MKKTAKVVRPAPVKWDFWHWLGGGGWGGAGGMG